ncbi:MAG: ABC transporter permease [Myxococcota bacterium]|nr:ABC transporter permease [Myxococcota bacterium]
MGFVTELPRPLVELTMARMRLFFREPSAVFWAFGFPLLLSIALGIAFRNRPPEALRVAIASGPEAERTLRDLAAARGITSKAIIESADAAGADLRSGKIVLVVVPGRPRTYRYDETRPEGRLARLLVDDALQRADGRNDPTPIADDRVAAPGARYIDFLIPGLLGLNIMSSGMWGIGYVVVEMRTKKLIKRMVATPMRRTDFLLSLLIMRGIFVLIEVPVLLGFGRLAFGVQIAGSALLVLALSFLGAFTFGGLGLFVASRAANTQTVGGLMNLVMMPMFVGSGVFFSTSNFPDGMQPWLRALPLTALNDALRAVTNAGATVRDVSAPMAVLGAWALVSYAAALKLFRWR